MPANSYDPRSVSESWPVPGVQNAVLLVYKVANSVYYSYLPSSQLKGFFLHLCHENTQECLLEHYCLGLVLLQVNSNFSVDLDTKWPKGIWTCWTHWYKKLRSFTTTERSDSTISQLNIKRNKDYKPKRKNRNFTLDWMYCWYCVLRESHYIPYAL